VNSTQTKQTNTASVPHLAASLRAASSIVALVITLTVVCSEATAKEKATTQNAPAKTKATSGKSKVFAAHKLARRRYYYVIAGNKTDLKKHTIKIAKLKEELRKRPVKGQEEKRQKYTQLVVVRTQLAKQNKIIVNAFANLSGETSKTVQKAMKKIEKLERAHLDITNKKMKRDWLTFDEVKEYRKIGYRYKTKDRHLLPHHRKNWNFSRMNPKKSD